MPRAKADDRGPRVYRDELQLDDEEYNTIQYRTTGGTSGVSARSLLDTQSGWDTTTSWAPVDDPNMDLDDDDLMFEEAMTADIGQSFDSSPVQERPPKKTRKAKSEASVCTI